MVESGASCWPTCVNHNIMCCVSTFSWIVIIYLMFWHFILFIYCLGTCGVTEGRDGGGEGVWSVGKT